MRLADKTAVVTGGASGFGLGIVEKFVAEGARVILADINPDAASQAAAGTGTTAATMDATEEMSKSEALGSFALNGT